MSWFKKIFSAWSSKEKFYFLAFVILAATAGLALLWNFFLTITVPTPARGGDYTEGMLGQPSAINPILAETQTDKSLVRLLFQNLKEYHKSIRCPARK